MGHTQNILDHGTVRRADEGITRDRVMAWEANGSPMHLCRPCGRFVRTNLDRCDCR